MFSLSDTGVEMTVNMTENKVTPTPAIVETPVFRTVRSP